MPHVELDPAESSAQAPVVAHPLPVPDELRAPGTVHAAFRAVLSIADLERQPLRRVSVGDLDVLVAATERGIVAVDDRCPHMAAPLSIGRLDGCVIACPLHNGRFDLEHGGPVQMPTTGGLGPDGVQHPTWSPPGSDPKPEPPGKKAEARRLTRVRRFRYYPVRVVDGMVEVALPQTPADTDGAPA